MLASKEQKLIENKPNQANGPSIHIRAIYQEHNSNEIAKYCIELLKEKTSNGVANALTELNEDQQHSLLESWKKTNPLLRLYFLPVHEWEKDTIDQIRALYERYKKQNHHLTIQSNTKLSEQKDQSQNSTDLLITTLPHKLLLTLIAKYSWYFIGDDAETLAYMLGDTRTHDYDNKNSLHLCWNNIRLDDRNVCRTNPGYAFTGANLSYSTFIRTTFASIELSHVNLTCSDLSFADLHDAKLSHANLSHSILEGARLEGADLQNANLIGAKLINAKIDKQVEDLIKENVLKINRPEYKSVIDYLVTKEKNKSSLFFWNTAPDIKEYQYVLWLLGATSRDEFLTNRKEIPDNFKALKLALKNVAHFWDHSIKNIKSIQKK